MATKLAELELDEMSGVESPANEIHGFAVMKAKAQELEPGEANELLKEVDRMEADFAVLYSALNSTEQYLGDAPEEVAAAAATLKQYVEGMFNEEEKPDEPPAADGVPTMPVMASREKDGRTLLQRLFKTKPNTPAEEASPVEKETETPKKDEPTPAEAEGLTKEQGDQILGALTEVGKALENIDERMKTLETNDETTRDALGKSLDRLGRVEAQRQGAMVNDNVPTPEPVDKSADSADRGRAALRSTIASIARQPGRREFLG
jgi:hypothetical protein